MIQDIQERLDVRTPQQKVIDRLWGIKFQKGIEFDEFNKLVIPLLDSLISLSVEAKEKEYISAVDEAENDYSHEAMGCGLEDRCITDRYEAMRYGFDKAIEMVRERMPEPKDSSQ